MTAIDDAQSSLDKISWYQRQLTAIHRDETLTPAGRERQYFNMSQSMELYSDVAYKAFDAAWQYVRSELKSLASRRRQASQRADDSWSFERLRYYHEQALTDIARAYSMQELEKFIRSVVASGSKEQARAMLECGAAVLNRFRGQVGVGGLVAWMDSEAEKIVRPPEFDKYDEQERELIQQIVKLRDMTVSGANMLPQAGIINLLKQVHIGAKVDAITGDFDYLITFDEPEPLVIPIAPERPAISKVTP